MKRTPRSKLQKDLFKKLGLGKLKFKQERWIGKYRCDCVNFDSRVIVEINGDAVHGNPRVFSANDMLPYGLTATQKWDQDAAKLSFLEDHGWCVITVWESDDLKAKKEIIEIALRICQSSNRAILLK